MALLKKYIRSEVARMQQNNIRFNVIGRREDLPDSVNREIDAAITATSENRGMVLTLALSYGSRQEIISATARVAAEVAAGLLDPGDIDEQLFSSRLFTAGMPDPDLLIRTSGETRISNFLLWQLAYTELYFTEVNWPEFGADELLRALMDYQERERRFGRTSDQLRSRR
jgi:undecaprenyl diphosphate synthase